MLISKQWIVWQRDNSEPDLSVDAVISRLCIQEAFYVAARISVSCGGTAGGTAGSTGQTGRRWWLWGSWKTQQQRVNTEIKRVVNTEN